MTQTNDPNKENKDKEDFNNSNHDYPDQEIRGVNGFQGGDSSSSDEEISNDGHQDGYQLLPQDAPSTDTNMEQDHGDFANFENFQSPTNVENEPVDSTHPSNPSIQVMIHQAFEEHRREETQERAAIFNSRLESNPESSTGSNSINLDESKVEVIKSAMSKVKLQSRPPEWLHEMSDEDWNKMLQQKLSKKGIADNKSS